MYELDPNYPNFLRRINENGSISAIPKNPDNRHYREFLAWLAEGNEPRIIDISE